MKKHPIQPLETDDNGVIRFKRNTLVEHLLAKGGIDMSQLACMEFSREDREQFAQLIGYSLSGFAELGYVSEETYNAAARMSEADETLEEARIAALEGMLAEIKTGLRAAACAAFGKHPADLK